MIRVIIDYEPFLGLWLTEVVLEQLEYIRFLVISSRDLEFLTNGGV